jgi:hypothetical protein
MEAGMEPAPERAGRRAGSARFLGNVRTIGTPSGRLASDAGQEKCTTSRTSPEDHGGEASTGGQGFEPGGMALFN